MARLGTYLLWSRARLMRDVFDDRDAICLVHGDTMSTLLSALIAKRAGQRVGHIEAGLRSHSLLHPFPEEIVRILVMRLSDLLFAPSPRAHKNICDMGLAVRAHLLPGNTGADTLAATLEQAPESVPELPPGYALTTIHRLETLLSRARLRMAVDFVVQAQACAPVVWVEHAPTQARLKAFGFDRVLDQAGVARVPLLPHRTFAHLLRGASFVITDGGSVQEEASVLGVPCLVMRRTTEREDGIGQNAVLARFDPVVVADFLKNPQRYRREEKLAQAQSPSAAILDILLGEAHT